MAEIKYQRPGDIAEVSSMGIHIPDESKLGTGVFTTVFSPRAFAAPHAFASIIINPRIFGIVASVNPGAGILVRIHDTDGTESRHQLAFLIPETLDVEVAHTLTVEFVNWHVLSAAIDGETLATMGGSKGH